MNQRLTQLNRMSRDEMRDEDLFLVVDSENKVSMNVALGDFRDYYNRGPRNYGFKKRPTKTLFEYTPEKESLWKRLKRLFFP